MKTSRRAFIGGAVAAAGWAAMAAPPAGADVVRPEDFGAKGDGVTNDTNAFAAMSAHINRRGGGTVELRKTTYIVGRQVAAQAGAEGWAYPPMPIMELAGLRNPLVIRGNGARLKCAPGLRYGTFDRATGRAVRRAMPNLRREEVASPYVAMIKISECRAPIEISDLELDGNLPKLLIGGPYGDTGHQIAAIGLFLQDNHSSEIVRNLHSHHHGQDGVEIDGDDRRRVRSRFENLVSEYNGRQGVSIIGGRGYDFTRCKFNHTGRSAVSSHPGAGVDIEAEGRKTNRDFTFTDCEFSNNFGCGLVADSGDSENSTFTRCKFIGTTSWSAWPNKPLFKFHHCTFVGAAVRAHVDRDPRRAAQFFDCTFRDDPKLSPTGKVYLADRPNHPIVDMGESRNVLFSRCSFILTHNGLLPWSWHAIYSDVTMVQAATVQATPKGKYLGRSSIRGNVDLYGSIVIGTLTVNGHLVPKGQLGGEPW